MYIEYLRTREPCGRGASTSTESQPEPAPVPDLEPEPLEPSISSILGRLTINELPVRIRRLDPTSSAGHYCTRPVEEYLVGLDGTMHNAVATRILCAAATWAYSDLRTFAAMMCHRGLYGEFVAVRVVNQPTLVDTTAHLFLSDTQKLAILAFRGTTPTNITNWLSNATTKMSPQEEGSIHGGFLNSSIVLLPILKDLLTSKSSLAEALIKSRDQSCLPENLFPKRLEKHRDELQQLKREIEAARRSAEIGANAPQAGAQGDALNPNEPVAPALYICGHSLGGAYAAMAAAFIQLEPTLVHVRRNLRSVYTFGQPMFADRTFAKSLEENLGDQVFRHRYRDDIVPRLPGTLSGASYYHFGRSYVSSRDDVWVREDVRERGPLRRLLSPGGQVIGSLSSSLIGVVAWVRGNIPLLQWIPLPVSWGDHSPLHYMRVSQAPRSGWEILGQELGGDTPGLFYVERAAEERWIPNE